MADVVIYTTLFCPFCVRAKALFDQLGVTYKEIAVDNDPVRRQEMTERSGGYTVPQIFIDEHPIGGCDELYALHRRDELASLLNS